MKKIRPLRCLLLILLASPALATSEKMFQIRCEAQVGFPRTELSAQSIPFPLTVEGFGHSQAHIDIGRLTLLAQVMMNSPSGKTPMQPTFWVEMYADGNPIQGMVSFSRVQGLELAHRQVNQPYSVYGMTQTAKDLPGVDFVCFLNRLI